MWISSASGENSISHLKAKTFQSLFVNCCHNCAIGPPALSPDYYSNIRLLIYRLSLPAARSTVATPGARAVAKALGLENKIIFNLSETRHCIFPWVGTVF